MSSATSESSATKCRARATTRLCHRSRALCVVSARACSRRDAQMTLKTVTDEGAHRGVVVVIDVQPHTRAAGARGGVGATSATGELACMPFGPLRPSVRTGGCTPGRHGRRSGCALAVLLAAASHRTAHADHQSRPSLASCTTPTRHTLPSIEGIPRVTSRRRASRPEPPVRRPRDNLHGVGGGSTNWHRLFCCGSLAKPSNQSIK